jgi:apolipoprotein N-acyltransferase
MRGQRTSYLWLALGGLLLVCVGWRQNVPIAAWLAPLFLIRFFRDQERWPATLVAIPTASLALFAGITGSWDFSLPAELGVGLLRALPFLAALYVDRWLARRLRPIWATLAYPATYVVADYLMGLSPLGTVFSPAATQFVALPLIQLASITGIWGIVFVMGWSAAIVNRIWDQGFDLTRAGLPPILFAGCLGTTLFLGGWRLSTEPPASTVRVAGITAAHDRDYWAAVIDRGTPRGEADQYRAELGAIEDQLFAASARAVGQGAKIVFWSEANAMVYPEDLQAFVARARAFARQHQVYFAPAFAVFRYGEMTADNKLLMIAPDGQEAYAYTKTKSWYPTDSDGILHTVDTPYGRVSSAICFDLDFPAFIRQAARQDVDVMLVPAFDWEPIKPYHTQVGLFRGLENGMSIVRQVNQGTSMAVDYQGRLLAYQDFFATADPVMIVDVPTQGVRTVYGLLGDWVPYLCAVFLVAAGVRSLFFGSLSQ